MISDPISTLLDGVESLRSKNQVESQKNAPTKAVGVVSVLARLNSFTEIVRYLNNRRSKGAILEMTSEAAVQDVLFVMLRPWVLDLVYENPNDKVAGSFSIKDFVSHSGKFVVEAKYIRSADHGKRISSELNDDIENYRYHRSCDDLIFFIYDPDGYIPDAAAVERHLSSNRVYDGKILRCHAVIKP